MLLEKLERELGGADGDDVDAPEAEACDFGVESLHVALYPPESWLVSYHFRQAADDREARRTWWKRVGGCSFRFVEE